MDPTLPDYSFFWHPSQNMSSSGFRAKKTGLWLADIIWSTNKRLVFFGGKPLEFMFWLWSKKTDFSTYLHVEKKENKPNIAIFLNVHFAVGLKVLYFYTYIVA